MKKIFTILIAVLSLCFIQSITLQASATCTLNNVTGSVGSFGGGLGPPGYITDIVGNGTSLLSVTYKPNIGNSITGNINFSSTGATITGSWHGTKITSYSANINMGTGTSDLSINAGAGHLFLTHTSFIGNGSFSGTDAGVTRISGGGVQLFNFDGWTQSDWETQSKKVLGDCDVTASYGYNSSNQFLLKATAVDASSVDFYWDGVSVGHDTSVPFEATATFGNNHVFTAVANWANGSLTYNYTTQNGGPTTPVVASGNSTSCMSYAGKAYCWGSGAYGALGDGNGTIDRSTPYLVTGLLSNVTSISMLQNGACATAWGSGFCWGKNDNGVIGFTPAAMPTSQWGQLVISGFYYQTAAGDDFACFLNTGGRVDCLGAGSVGQMGNGTITATNTTPVTVYASGIKKIAAGGDTACAITSSDRVECWGRDNRGQVGNGGGAASYLNTPQDVGLSNIIDIAVGYRHACALEGTTGVVSCWGDNNYGQLGTGTNDNLTHVSPIGPSMLSNVNTTHIFSGRNYNTCATMSTGAMKCVGENSYGELGFGATSSFELSPVTPTGFTSGVYNGAIGGSNGAAFRNGHVYFFGDNTYTQIGSLAASNPQLTPIQVTGF
jgi:hypothetical protein